jgi:hypothetical protein
MSKLTIITDRALELASQAGTSLKHAVPSADKLLQTGAALGVAKTGGKLAVNFVRRNPAVATAPIEGKSRRVEARKVNGTNKTSTARKTGTPRRPRSTASRSTEN